MQVEKRNLIIVDSIPNIIIALEIRRQIHKNELFDLVITNNVKELENIYNRKILDRYFDSVKLANVYSINSAIKKFMVIGNIDNAIRYYFDNQLMNCEYTDIYVWNPSSLFYCLYAYIKKNKKPNIHVFCDAFGGFSLEGPDSRGNHPFFDKGFWSALFKTKYKPDYIRDLEYDYYMFRKNVSSIPRKHRVVEIPSDIFRDEQEINIFNDIFSFDCSLSIEQRFIFLANVPGEMKSASEIDNILRFLVSEIKDDLVIKPHPRVGSKYYLDFGVEVLSGDFPWDLYCLNNDISNKIIIADETSAIFLPALIYDRKFTVIWLREMLDGEKVYSDFSWEWFNSKMIESGCRVYDVCSLEELKDALLKES